jgi:hypothetical protein
MSDRDLLARITAGPRFLLLGQGRERRRIADATNKSGWFFPEELSADPATEVPDLRPEELTAYASLIGDPTLPDGLKSVTSLAWNGVLTTRIDGATSRWFETDWRRVVPAAAIGGRGSRSTTELQVRYLFGGLDLPEDERPPDSVLAWVDAQRNATDALSELASSGITPRGVLLIEGWSPRDWLSAKDLYNFASRLAPGQVHLFSATDDVVSNSLIGAAATRGIIVTHAESLVDFLTDASSAGLLVEPSAEAVDRTRLIPAGSGFVAVDVATWNRIIGTARPVDLELLEPFPYASGPMTYQRFRSFLGAPEGAPPWRAVASGMKLPRTFEPNLLRVVEAALDDPEDVGPILLQGQTAAGKSLALVWLAQVLAKSGRAAVLHQARRRDRPSATEVEAYGLWAEGAAGLKTVLIWDGMVDADDYFALHRQLRARGQRVLIVGSTYLTADGARQAVTAPIRLDSEEAENVTAWLRSYGIEMPPAAGGADTSFLALLYRALPETEAGLRRGLALEMRAAESGMEALSRDRKQHEPDTRMTAIAEALMAAGFDIETLAPATHAPEDLPDLAFSERSTTEQLSAMLLVAGRRGLSVPLELALRIVGREGSSAIVDFIRRFDIFRWTEEADGSQFLGVRTRLEAELLAREDLTDLAEIDVVTSFIANVRPDMGGRTGGDEVQFIVDLLDLIGPQSDEQGRYARWYGELADAFANQRRTGGMVHPRLVLMEVNLSREFVKRAQRTGDMQRDERLAQFRDAEQLLLRTLEEADTSPRARLNLYVELAASIGSQVFELVSEQDPATEGAVSALIERLVDAVMRAREADPENIYPVDVLAWTARDAVSAGELGPEAKLNLLVDAQASLDSLDPQDLSPRQQAKYRVRQAEIAKLLGDKDLEASHLQELAAMDNPAAYYLLASRAATSSSDDALDVALTTLLSAPMSIRDDWKCARLILDLWWQQRTGDHLLRGERRTVPFTESAWADCLDLVGSLRGAAGFDQYRIAFVRGLALFHLGSISNAQAEFRSLGSLGLDVSRRVYLAYLAGNPDGTPMEFTGRVASATPDGRRGRVWVDQLRAEVDFVPLRFSPEAYRSKNEVVPAFHIGFNYRGPIADPIRPGGRAPGPRPA